MPWAISRRSTSVSRACSCNPDQLVRVELTALQPVAGQPEPGDEGDDVLLDAVMQVAFDAAPLVVLRHDETGSRR